MPERDGSKLRCIVDTDGIGKLIDGMWHTHLFQIFSVFPGNKLN